MATKYFLLIDGINGGSTDKDHVGWFEIDGFEFDISNTGGTVGGGGGGAGKATFSPLEVALSLDPGLAAVLADVATGKHIKAVQLEGVTTKAATPSTTCGSPTCWSARSTRAMAAATV